jgi:hypothetical protein
MAKVDPMVGHIKGNFKDNFITMCPQFMVPTLDQNN